MPANYFYPTSKNAIQKNLAAQLLSTATTGDAITFDDVDGIQNKPGVLVINRIDANNASTPSAREFISFTGTSGNTVLIDTRNVDGSGATRTHAIGSIVEFISDAVWAQRIIDQALVEHGTDGTHSVANMITGGSVKDEDDMASNSATALATQQSIKAYVDTDGGSLGGWTAVTDTWVYASADDPTFTFTIAGVDLTTKYSAGMRIKLTQTTVKYFIITAVAFSTDTTITVYGGTDYDLANAAITSPYFSTQKAPVGFPLDPSKWSVITTDTTLREKTSGIATNTWYNISSALSISIPIGVWDVSYQAAARADVDTGSCNVRSTLSTANNSQSDAGFSTYNVTSATIIGVNVHRRKTLVIAAKTTYYLNVLSVSANTITYLSNDGNLSNTIIRATCAYL